MNEDEKEIAALIQARNENARGYADHFGWSTNREIEEWGVVLSLNEALQKSGAKGFSNIQARGRGNDPPDCEALTQDNKRVAIEVTELVREEAIRAFKAGNDEVVADWDKKSFLSAVSVLIEKKDCKFEALKGGPYPGGHILVIFTDEPLLHRKNVSRYLENSTFPITENLTKIFFLIAYDPQIESYPFFTIACQNKLSTDDRTET